MGRHLPALPASLEGGSLRFPPRAGRRLGPGSPGAREESAPQLGRGLKASVGILFEAALNNGFELWRALRAALGQPLGLGVQVMAEYLRQVAAEHGLSGEQEVGDRTEGVQVGACVDGIWISQRLRSHV